MAATARSLRRHFDDRHLWPLYDVLKLLREGPQETILLPVKADIADRVSDIRDSLEIHRDDVLELGHGVHFASKAAALAGDTPERPRAAKLRVHKKANAAKHAWSPKERWKPKEHVFDVGALAFFPARPPGH